MNLFFENIFVGIIVVMFKLESICVSLRFVF